MRMSCFCSHQAPARGSSDAWVPSNRSSERRELFRAHHSAHPAMPMLSFSEVPLVFRGSLLGSLCCRGVAMAKHYGHLADEVSRRPPCPPTFLHSRGRTVFPTYGPDLEKTTLGTASSLYPAIDKLLPLRSIWARVRNCKKHNGETSNTQTTNQIPVTQQRRNTRIKGTHWM